MRGRPETLIVVDPIAIPCRECSAPPGRFCFVVTILGPCEDSTLPHSHGVRIEDAIVVGRIVKHALVVGPAR